MKREGLKPVRKYISTKNGMSQRTYWIKDEKPYTFKVTLDSKPNGKLSVFARSLDEAKKKAKGWERWIQKKGYSDKVVLSSGRLD